LRKIFFAAFLCVSALAVSSSVDAHGLTTTPDADGAMLIPTYTGGTAQVIPVYYHHHYHHYYHHHYYHHHG
jgi:hypothetical protein